MKCNKVGQMRRIAHAGAMRIAQSGTYTWNHATFYGSPVIEVHKNDAEGTMYRVDLTIGENGWCSCPFHEENREIDPNATVCKHTLWVSWMLEAEAVKAERELFRELAQSGAGLGIPQVIGTVQAGTGEPKMVAIPEDSRLAKMYAHDADLIEARTF